MSADGQDHEESKTENEIVCLKLDNYTPVQNKNTLMYSTYEPDYIFAQLISKLLDKDCNPTVNNKKWKLTYNLVREEVDGLPSEGCRV
jgi:hypothetical protein